MNPGVDLELFWNNIHGSTKSCSKIMSFIALPCYDINCNVWNLL